MLTLATLTWPQRRFLARFGLPLLFLVGIPLAAWLGFLALPFLADHLGYTSFPLGPLTP